jgi:predicted nucleotidyltransferase
MNTKDTTDRAKGFLSVDLKELLQMTREHRTYFTTIEIAQLLLDAFGEEIDIIIKDIQNEKENRNNTRAKKNN